MTLFSEEIRRQVGALRGVWNRVFQPRSAGQDHSDKINPASLLPTHHCYPPHLRLLDPLRVSARRSLHHGKLSRGTGDRCAPWRSSPSPHSSPCDFRCPTYQGSSPASFASGFSGSIPGSRTGAIRSCRPEGVHPTPGYLKANLLPKRAPYRSCLC